jgi:hypothetical protein
LNNTVKSLELDTGSAVSIINQSMLNDIKNVTIFETVRTARDYGNNSIKFIGEAVIKVKIGNVIKNHAFLVVDDNLSPLFGRDLCAKFDFTINMVNNIGSVSTISQPDLFNKFNDFLSPDYTSQVKTKIKLELDGPCKPVFCKARSVPFRYRCLVKEELERLNEAGIITKIDHSKWACPIVPVLKANGRIRICGDFSLTLNNVTRQVIFPMPTIEYVLSSVGEAKIFSTIDLQNAYLQLPLDDEARKITVINTPEGLFQYNYLAFGISSASAIFQSFMTKVLSGISNTIVYQDDILVMTSTQAEHVKVLDKVLSALKTAGVKVNTEKCKFFTESIQYLGYIFDKYGARPSLEKTRAIVEAPAPVNIKEVQSFIGLCNYYHRFVPNFSTVFAPLYSLLKKNAKFTWGIPQQKCFDTIKNLFTSDKIVKLFNQNLPTVLETDASNYGIGAVMLQKHPEGWMPVQFVSRSLNSAEKNYSQIDKEALGILFGCERLRNFLLGAKFVIRTDHRPLLKLLGRNSAIPAGCSARIIRWALRLSQFNYELEYIPGKDNVQSDCLSRLPLKETDNTPEPAEIVLLIKKLNDYHITCSDIQRITDKDIELCKIKHFVMYGFPAVIEPCLSAYFRIKDELSLLNGCIMWNNRVIIPVAARDKVLQLLHESHPGMEAMKSIARSLVWYPKMDSDIVDLVKACQMCSINSARPPKNSKSEWPNPERKWSRIHIDHFFLENHILFIVVDALSKYIECEIVKTVNSSDTIDALKIILSRNGIPDIIVSDNATSFKSAMFEQFVNEVKIKHVTTPPYSSASNGMAERSVRVIKDLLKKNISGSIKSRLAQVLLHYRNTPQSTTGIAPAIALNGRNYVTNKERINPRYSIKSNFKFLNNIPQYEIGDSVIALNLREGAKWLAATIKEKLGNNVYNVYVLDTNVIWKRHVEQLLPRKFNPDNAMQTHVTNLPVANTSPNITNDELQQCPNHVSTGQNINQNDCPPDESAEVECTDDVVLRRSNRIRKPIDRYEAGQCKFVA